MYLPRLQNNDRAVEDEKRPWHMLSGTETILLVEDDKSVRELAGAVLSKLGYTLIEAGGGRRGFGCLRELPGKAPPALDRCDYAEDERQGAGREDKGNLSLHTGSLYVGIHRCGHRTSRYS